jgi:Protein of unknown function (DUF1153)
MAHPSRDRSALHCRTPSRRSIDHFVGIKQVSNEVLKLGRLQCVRLAERKQYGRAQSPKMKYVIGPDGSPLTLADLPAPGTTRWVIRRKAEVVAAVRGGLLSFEEACDRYRLTADEFLAWQRSIDRHGLAGLRTTRIQQYRPGSSDWRRP